MNDKFKPLNIEDEVLSVEVANKFLNDYPIFKISQFMSKLKSALQGYSNDAQKFEKWLGEGINCEILKFGAKGWQKGKVRIKVTLEFCPDQPEIEETPTNNNLEINQIESPLDDIRQMMNGNS